MNRRGRLAAAVVTWALALAEGLTVGARAAGPPQRTVSDALDTTSRLLPFPDDFSTVPDRSTPTGRRGAFPVQAMPVNAAGVPIDSSAWNLNDGFSPSTPILVHVPGLDPARSHLAPSPTSAPRWTLTAGPSCSTSRPASAGPTSPSWTPTTPTRPSRR